MSAATPGALPLWPRRHLTRARVTGSASDMGGPYCKAQPARCRARVFWLAVVVLPAWGTGIQAQEQPASPPAVNETIPSGTVLRLLGGT